MPSATVSTPTRTHDFCLAFGAFGLLALPVILWNAIKDTNAESR